MTNAFSSTNSTSTRSNGTIEGTEINFVFGRPLHLNLIMLIFGTLVAATNGGLIYRLHTKRNFLKAKRYVFVANLTFCDLAAGMCMIILAVVNAIGGDGPLVCLLQGETCLNLCLTMSSYTCSIIVQFIAVRYPIYYKTNVTSAKVAAVVAFCWLFSFVFSGIKLSYALLRNHDFEKAKKYYFYPYIDVTVKFLYLIGNCVCFLYVLIIALKRRRQQQLAIGSNTRSSVAGSKYGEDDNENEEENEKKTNERTPFRRKAATYLHHYQAIITSGIRLIVYIVTCAPLTVYCAYRLHMEERNDIIFWESRDVGVSLVLLWFCRALIDPLITLIREKPMLARRTSTMSGGSTRLSRMSTSRMDSRVSESNAGHRDSNI